MVEQATNRSSKTCIRCLLSLWLQCARCTYVRSNVPSTMVKQKLSPQCNGQQAQQRRQRLQRPQSESPAPVAQRLQARAAAAAAPPAETSSAMAHACRASSAEQPPSLDTAGQAHSAAVAAVCNATMHCPLSLQVLHSPGMVDPKRTSVLAYALTLIVQLGAEIAEAC